MIVADGAGAAMDAAGMTGGPPADARVLEVSGLDAPGRVAAVTAAVRRHDPAAGLWFDPARGLVAVASAAPDPVLGAALVEAGCQLRPRRGGVGGALLFGVLFGIAGLGGGLVVGWMVGLGIYEASSNCRVPGSCTMMAPAFALLGGVVGGPAALVAGLIFGGLRRGR
jgi:hypothetical protein